VEYERGHESVSTLPGHLSFASTPAGSKEVIYDSRRSAPGRAVVVPRGSADVNVAVLNYRWGGSSSIIDNLLAQFKVISKSTGDPRRSMCSSMACSALQHPHWRRQRTSAPPPDRTLTVEATATPGARCCTYSPVLLSAMDASIILEAPPAHCEAV
jgi:hypothetical protein